MKRHGYLYEEEVMRYFPDDTLCPPLERRRGIAIGNLTNQFFADVRASVMSWIGHAQPGDTWGLRRQLLAATPFVRIGPGQLPGGVS